MDIGSTGFMLVATSLVMLMTPGLAFFYGGLVGKKNVLTIMFQSFISMGVTTIIWFIAGYSLCFSGDFASHTDFFGIWGNLHKAFFMGISVSDLTPNNIPVFVHIAYQMMFAQITPALITGAFTNRVRFPAYLMFLTLWLLFVYFPFAHMVWGGGLLQSVWKIQDFAGGIVVHAIAGMAAFAAVLFVGRRRVEDKGLHNIPLVALGTGLLWFGWYGFNAGSEFSVDKITCLAFLNTDIAASLAGPTWLVLDWIFTGKPRFLGFLTGAVAGLATITPAAGYVSPQAAVIIGIAASLVCYLAIFLKNRAKLDDALDVWGVHGVGGILGVILLGVFGSSLINPNGANGLIFGGGSFFARQTIAVLCAAVYAFAFTWVILWVINKITPVRTTKEEENGLDVSIQGETAYDLI